jgi:acetyl esterase/lipase
VTRLFTGLIALLILSPAAAIAQPDSFRIARIPAPAEDKAIPLYPEGALPKPKMAESWSLVTGQISPTTRIESRQLRNVGRPTIMPFLPDPAKATGAAVIVAPGGAFLSLSMFSEGYDVARWLADRGIAAFVLKYRLNETPEDDAAFMRFVGERMGAVARLGHTPDIEEPRATEDGLQALRVVRARARDWDVDPARVGMIGFSAGAMTVMRTLLAGKGAERPDFIGYIYGPMTAIDVPADAPPMFAALALDDGLFGRQGFGLVEAWHKARRPVELHAYEKGDHGFGMGRPGTTTTLLMDEFLAWLDARGLLKGSGRDAALRP